MKKIVLCLGIGFVSMFANAQNGLEKIIVEKYYISNVADSLLSVGKIPVGSVTYRLYVDLKQGYTFQSAYGDPKHELELATTTTFFNNEDYGSTSPNSISVVQAKSNTVMLDSWLSVGAACKGYFGIQKKLDNGVGTFVNTDGILANEDTTAGIPLTTQDGLIIKTTAQTLMGVTTIGIDDILPILDATNATDNGQSFSTNNGAWAALNGAVGADTNNLVLIAQVTTNGIFTYKLNIQIGTPVAGESENYVWDSPVNNELTIPSLSASFTPIVTPKITIDNSISTSAHIENKIVPLAATITSGGTISKVEFFVDNISVGVDNTEPYTVDYTTIKGTHSLTVKVTNENGITTSNPVSFTIAPAVGSNLVDSDSFGKVYPNPVSDIVNIEFSSKQNNVTVQLFDVIGNIVLEKHFDSISQNQIEKLNSSSLTPGIYYMLVSGNGKQASFKVVKK